MKVFITKDDCYNCGEDFDVWENRVINMVGEVEAVISEEQFKWIQEIQKQSVMVQDFLKKLYDHKPGEGLSPAEGEERFVAPVIPDEMTDGEIERMNEIFGG